MTEKSIQTEIFNKIGSRPDCRIFRNSVGFGCSINGNPQKFGLCAGSGDLIGIQKITITPDMVGKTVGRFVSIEVKSDKGRVSQEQKRFAEIINKFGGKAFIARSAEEAERQLREI